MKKLIYFFLAFVFTAVSCTREMGMEPAVSTGYELLLQTRVDGMATKAVGDAVADIPELKEDDIQTLDVYVSGTFKGGATPTVKHFSLSAGDLISTTSGGIQTWRLSRDWRTDNIVVGNSYTVYLAANSSKVKASADSGDATVATSTLAGMGITSLDVLKNVIEFDYDPAEDNPDGGKYPYCGTNTSGDVNPFLLGVHKLFTEGSITADAGRYYTSNKRFLMNGTVSFTATLDLEGNNISVPTAVTLTRAAAKIAVNIRFKPQYLDAKHWTPCGQPKWRFCNFAFNTPIFSDLTPAPAPTISRFTTEETAGMPLYSSLSAGAEYTDSDYHFGFSTYSYPLSWEAKTADRNAPAIIVSVCYRDDSNTGIPEASRPVKWLDYKIPVVNPEEAITSLERNKIYTIDATITDNTLVPDLYAYDATYSIIPWDSSSSLPVTKRDNSYIDVIPDAVAEPSGTQKVTDVILRGNGQQSILLEVLKPKTKSFDIAYYGTTGATQSNPFGQTGTPTDYPLTGTYHGKKGNIYYNAAFGAQVPYYINLDGDIRNTIGNSSTPADNYIQNCFVKQDDEHLLILSEALPNKGVKYMKIRVYLEDNPSIYMDVNIRHYPTDCLMSTEGLWSSRSSAAIVNGSFAPIVRGPEDYSYTWHSTFDESEWDGWTYTGSKYSEWANASEATYNTMPADKRRIVPYGKEIERDVYFSHVTGGVPETNYRMGDDSGTYEVWDKCFVKFTDSGGDYNGGYLKGDEPIGWTSPEASEQHGTSASADTYYYWGDTPSVVDTRSFYDIGGPSENTIREGTSKAYDYYVYDGWVGVLEGYVCTYYKYANHYRTKFYGPQHQCVRYCAYEVTEKSSTVKRWANWIEDASNYKASDIRQATMNDRFNAMEVEGSTWYRLYDTNVKQEYTDAANNNHIYIVKLSETSTEYTIGRPIIDDDFGHSNDNVVSPAFMIASQLGNFSRNPLEKPGLYTTLDAATYASLHCKTYLEYGRDGNGNLKYYTGWRLPTKAEINIIINYQGNKAEQVPALGISGDDRIIAPVLYAGYYISLDRDAVATNYDNTNSNYTVRCVRDLTPEEIAQFGLD